MQYQTNVDINRIIHEFVCNVNKKLSQKKHKTFYLAESEKKREENVMSFLIITTLSLACS